MAEPITDLLMMFSLDGSSGIAAGSSASVDSKQTLNAGFTAGRFFELEEFGFGMKLDPQEGTSATPAGGQVTAAAGSANTAGGKAPPPKPAEKDFAIWRSVKAGESEPALPYRCKPDAFSIKRMVDVATPVLFAHCAKRQQFESATIIKRFRGHGDGSGGTVAGPKTLTFLRMDFSKVMLTSMDWSDGEVVVETCRFTFQSFKVQVLKQNNDGSTSGSPVAAEWAREAKLKSTGR